MTQRLSYTQSSAPGERFAPDAFDGQIGKVVPMNIEGRPVEGGCTVVGASVADDGRSVQLTLEVPDGVLPSQVTEPGGFSVGG